MLVSGIQQSDSDTYISIIDYFKTSNIVPSAFLAAQLVKNPPAMKETLLQFLGWEVPLEKG